MRKSRQREGLSHRANEVTELMRRVPKQEENPELMRRAPKQEENPGSLSAKFMLRISLLGAYKTNSAI